jgi:hypothetical protein
MGTSNQLCHLQGKQNVRCTEVYFRKKCTLEKVTFTRNSVSMCYFEACFFFGCITLFSVYILLKYASVII